MLSGKNMKLCNNISQPGSVNACMIGVTKWLLSYVMIRHSWENVAYDVITKAAAEIQFDMSP